MQDTSPRPPWITRLLTTRKGRRKNIATPESASPDFALPACRVFRKSGYRFCGRNTRQIFSDAFSKRRTGLHFAWKCYGPINSRL